MRLVGLGFNGFSSLLSFQIRSMETYSDEFAMNL
jgi:hypothetical protein